MRNLWQSVCQRSRLAQVFIKKLKEMLEPVSGGTLPINVYYQSAKGRALLRLGIQWSDYTNG